MAAQLSADRRPGSHLIVRYPDPVDPGWAHERLVLWSCAGDVTGVTTSIVLTPDGDVYEEAEADWETAEVFTIEYPAWASAFKIRQFDEPMIRAAVIRHINIARREVKRVLAGRQKATRDARYVVRLLFVGDVNAELRLITACSWSLCVLFPW